MPTYQYACTACDNQFEIVQKFSDDALTVCPSCQGELRKVFSAVGIVFKGSGFYRTDSRSSGSSTVSSTTSSSSNSSSSSASSTSSSGSAESKPAAAPAAAAS
ncbi:FmdB family transcriptional regulator [Planomonospora sp. ID91781]|uniref:FmdB family zinc ribbon protein n=1 Tax=Planomonospora sp. ID91781 TaxID=2738135 RepID=UPI000A0422C5|nr:MULTISPECIES: FmdB family zinc ribbon protein [Planomonospora]MBG0819331.1 FmdB family transcriptional regulator [Planomonospora sp. ID91781]